MNNTVTVAVPVIGDVTLAVILVGENEILDNDGVEAGDVIVGGTVALHHVSLLYNQEYTTQHRSQIRKSLSCLEPFLGYSSCSIISARSFQAIKTIVIMSPGSRIVNIRLGNEYVRKEMVFKSSVKVKYTVFPAKDSPATTAVRHCVAVSGVALHPLKLKTVST
jgi:hypothetical protein